MTVTDHFIGGEAGLEQILFEDGTIWDRTFIADNLRDGRFNAQNDVYLFGVEDEISYIEFADLVLNDAETGVEDLELVSVQAAVDGTVWIEPDGRIAFLGDQDVNGDVFFAYTVRDPSGRESTARVEVNLAPVNDAPVAVDDPLQYGIEDVPLRIRIENLLANDYDVDGDAESESLKIVSLEPLTDGDGDPIRPYRDNDEYDGEGTDVTWKIDGDYIELAARPDHFGFAGFRYTLEDADGAQSKADVEIYFAPLNDAPRITDGATSAKLDEVTVFTVDELMAKVYDIEGDTFTFVGLHAGADGNASTNGSETFDVDTGEIFYTPEELGAAYIEFDVIDERGAEATLAVNINVRPLNLPPVANDDRGIQLLQNGMITIDPADLLLNDTDPDDDVLVFDSVYRFAENGKVRVNDDGMIEFVAREDYNGAASFEYTVSDGNGGFDSAVVHLTVLPVNYGPDIRNDVVAGLEDGPLYVIPAEAFGNDLDLDGDVLFFEDATLLGEFTHKFLSADFTVRATAANNMDLPEWLTFDADTLTFTGDVPVDITLPVEVAVFVTDPVSGAVHNFRFAWEETSEIADLSIGLSVENAVMDGFVLREAYDWTLDDDADGVATFDIDDGSFAAQVNGGRALPSWLTFDEATRSLAISDFDVDENDTFARVQIVYTPAAKDELPENEYYATDRGFTLEFVIDPTDPQLNAINAVLAGNAAQQGTGQFGLDLSSHGGLSVARESGAPLNDWLSFDDATLTFSGTPPSEYVGAVPVRIDVAAGVGIPAMSIITEAVVDETYTVAEVGNLSGFNVVDLPERIDVTAPEDFNGALAFDYTAEDEKGGQSDEAAQIVFNVRATRELAQANEDRVDLFEGGSVTFQVADLLANDRDDDGDYLRITGFGDPINGQIDITSGSQTLNPPASLLPLAGGTWVVTLAGGAALPTWMTVDAATGAVTAEIPLDVRADFDLTFTNSDGATNQSETITASLDGNAAATVMYTPFSAFAGEDVLTYTLTDDAEGAVTGNVILDVASLLDPPIAVEDLFTMFEDGSLTLLPEQLLFNDVDVDGDAIRFLGVEGAEDGFVVFENGEITFTPTPNFAGETGFTYRITDDTHGESTGFVVVDVVSTNQRPEAGSDTFETEEDVPFEFSIAEILANDIDPDGDTISFDSIETDVNGGRILELPADRYQFVPDENLNGSITFNYRVTDGRAYDVGEITFNIGEVNDAPIANPDGFFFGTQDQPIIVDFADLLFNDRDIEGDAFLIVEIFDADNGTVYQDGETAVFQGREGYFGDGGFNYRVTDEHGATSIGYAEVIVMPLFDVPVAVSDAGYEMLEEGSLIIDQADLMAKDDLPLGSDVMFLGLTTSAGHAQNATVEELEDGQWRVSTAEDFFGELVLEYRLTNETGFEIPTAVTIDVIGTDDAPVAQDDAITIGEDEVAAVFVSQLLANDSDPDYQGFALTQLLDAENIDVELTLDGQVLITPDAGYFGEAWFEYEIVDSAGLRDFARVEVTVLSENDAPIIDLADVMFGNEDEAITITFADDAIIDPDGDALFVELRGEDGASLPVWLAFDPETLTITGQPPENVNGDFALELFVSDGDEEVLKELVLRIGAVNDAPVANDDTGSADEGSNVVIDVLTNDTDIDGNILTVSAIGGTLDPANGIVTQDAEGRLVYTTTDPDFHGNDRFSYEITDGQTTSEAFVDITINPVNDAPVLVSPLSVDSQLGGSDFSVALQSDAFTDVDGDTLTYRQKHAGQDDTASRTEGLAVSIALTSY